MDKSIFAECMNRNMEKQNISVKDVSELSGIPESRIKEYLSGKFKPKSYEIVAIGKAINVPPAVLMSGGGNVHLSYISEDGHKNCKWKEF